MFACLHLAYIIDCSKFMIWFGCYEIVFKWVGGELLNVKESKHTHFKLSAQEKEIFRKQKYKKLIEQ